MVLNVYAVRDARVGFGAPIIDQVDTAAIRNFSTSFTGSGLPALYPAEFDLYKIGTYDTTNGHIAASKVPELICSGTEAINMVRKE